MRGAAENRYSRQVQRVLDTASGAELSLNRGAFFGHAEGYKTEH